MLGTEVVTGKCFQVEAQLEASLVILGKALDFSTGNKNSIEVISE